MRIAGYAFSASLLLLVSACATTNDAPIADHDEASPFEPAADESTPTQEPSEPSEPSDASAQDDDLTPAQQLTQAQQDLKARVELQALLLQDALQKAESFMQNGDLEHALAAAEAALAIDQDNRQAIDLWSRINTLNGGQGTDAANMHTELEAQWRIRMEQIRSEVMDSLAKAKNLRARGEYVAAINELSLART